MNLLAWIFHPYRSAVLAIGFIAMFIADGCFVVHKACNAVAKSCLRRARQGEQR
jgi:hypothetical protein